jgi:hypothetical protein
MAPIEHVWDALGRRVDNRHVKPTTGATLRQTLLEEWNNLSQTVIQNIILSMRRRWVANPYLTVYIRNTETGFVRKQHFLPSLPCPLQMGSSPC